jgi:hypothetical protein
MLPTVASGIPLAVAQVWVMTEITPESGAPAIPGERITEQPIVTGGPGTRTSKLTTD